MCVYPAPEKTTLVDFPQDRIRERFAAIAVVVVVMGNCPFTLSSLKVKFTWIVMRGKDVDLQDKWRKEDNNSFKMKERLGECLRESKECRACNKGKCQCRTSSKYQTSMCLLVSWLSRIEMEGTHPLLFISLSSTPLLYSQLLLPLFTTPLNIIISIMFTIDGDDVKVCDEMLGKICSKWIPFTTHLSQIVRWRLGIERKLSIKQQQQQQ